ncbi:LLM class flavin-dependent oxidoreductase [Pseudonocardia lacus]|uniref:LLM class flavin-dependent oxidoreductase n=1 Tax=Pseudonocardia lacus TaxID=2835865 RepID=UPI001BDC51BF|nr:LLM class flavin-dependent oxidoreductase [Pseudonocardia lacus]
MKLGVTMPVDDGLTAPQYLELVRAAEECGYDSAWVGEVAGPEAFSMLGLMLGATDRIRVGTGIASIYPRTAPLAAMAYATLASAAPGRVLAGLGVSSPLIVREWHGLAYERPVEKAEAYIAALRAAWAGEKVRGFRPTLPVAHPPPIVLGAMNPRMLRLAGRVADGVFLTWCPPSEVAPRLALVRDGEREAGRAPGSVWAMVSFWAYAADRVDEAMARMRRLVLQYAMVPTHAPSFAGSFPSLARATDLWTAGDRRGALALVPDGAVHHMCAVGDGGAVAERAAAFAAEGIDLAVALTPGATAGDLDGPLATIRRTARAAGL